MTTALSVTTAQTSSNSICWRYQMKQWMENRGVAPNPDAGADTPALVPESVPSTPEEPHGQDTDSLEAAYRAHDVQDFSAQLDSHATASVIEAASRKGLHTRLHGEQVVISFTPTEELDELEQAAHEARLERLSNT